MENIESNQQQFISKEKLIEILKGFLEKPQEEILLSELEAALQLFWESRSVETSRAALPDSDAMNKLAELIKQYKEKSKSSPPLVGGVRGGED